MKTKKKLIREQLQTALDNFKSLADEPIPSKGWIRAIRDALGMSGRQLSQCIHVTKQRVSEIEKQELEGSATLKTMRKVAEGLDCVFVYGFVPRTTLENTIRKQAQKVAEKRHARVSQTMKLEDQGLSHEENRNVLNNMIEDLVQDQPSNLWDE